ncbi:signal transduction histidine kinase [Nocardioides luteus]|uniref:histidine kinase n=1 Tax=Nocardioides luteus TaxID=1844 RepID=A0ABQ5T045_9ACTN|nr:sensor domain-containing protein [Nocardioides luteus]MDR7310932.1 signal transduction histidine kinase [Nocardioides luteus]GGR39674.1 histidine kinase [Nocardioides luteus]GLJ69288.1 histidine kinase [Nocardioides luteus]
MSPPPDVWTALRSWPWRLLASGWPWRALAYLVSGAAVGVVVAVALFALVGVGLLTLVILVGVLVLAGVPLLAALVADVERKRLRLILPEAGRDAIEPPQPIAWGDRLRALRRLRISGPEVGYTVLLGTVLWLVDAVALNLLIALPGVLVLAPVLIRADAPVAFGPWQITTPTEAWIAAVPGLVLLVVGLYATTLLAAAQASLARLLLEPAQTRLTAAVADLRRSRVDLVDAFETERRRIERDLHDGAQQRLVALTLTLGLAELEMPEGAGLDLVRQAHSQAETALAELRATVRGIHPRVLVDHGLTAAVHELADAAGLPVAVDLQVDGRLPPPVEAAAYFVVAEALTNTVRHAGATSARIQGRVSGDRLEVEIRDDGSGGAAMRPGGGLAGLATRLAALDGDLEVTSPPGGPTEVRMTCPTALP